SDARHQLVTETWSTQTPVPVDEYADFYGNPVKRLLMPEGPLGLRYDAVVSVPDEPDPDGRAAPQLTIDDIPGELLHFTLPSRYCLSDQLMGMAWDLFGQTDAGGARVQAVCDWVHDNIKFQYGTSNPMTTAVDVLEQRKGVCRDLAHLAITFCRALNIPARYVFGYLPDLYVPPPDSPMDFAAWMEVYLGDRWWTFDPRNNMRRVGRVLIGRGRDALDVAMLTTVGSPTSSRCPWTAPRSRTAATASATSSSTSSRPGCPMRSSSRPRCRSSARPRNPTGCRTGGWPTVTCSNPRA